MDLKAEGCTLMAPVGRGNAGSSTMEVQNRVGAVGWGGVRGRGGRTGETETASSEGLGILSVNLTIAPLEALHLGKWLVGFACF